MIENNVHALNLNNFYGDEIFIGEKDPGFQVESLIIPHHYKKLLQHVMIPYGLVNDRIEKLALDIVNTYESESLMPICVLKGSFQFFNSLIQKIQMISSFRAVSLPIAFHFIRAKSYTGMVRANKIEITGLDNMDDIENKNVLIVEDIVDSGSTLNKLMETFKLHKPKSIKVASLLYKRNMANQYPYKPEYIGFNIPNKFVVGYGLDYHQYFRDLNHICVINELGIQQYQEKDGHISNENTSVEA
ncbi:unnamed protein product [Gordionus sp. m RMFG-2023]|uniref:hypoxanthine-guanine phosphoribosyltransferase-like n=1 Tax=Gordionus sp. m RMFG-2023 TaxID=3053472 RepID=UPI0030E0CDB5